MQIFFLFRLPVDAFSHEALNKLSEDLAHRKVPKLSRAQDDAKFKFQFH